VIVLAVEIDAWRLNPASSLHYRHWNNEWVVFDVGSGQTHEMGTIAAVALMHCENGWIELADVASGVARDLDLPKENGLAGVLLPLFDQFKLMGLLECGPK